MKENLWALEKLPVSKTLPAYAAPALFKFGFMPSLLGVRPERKGMDLNMNTKPKYIVVDANVLPDVFLKVVAAKSLLAGGKAKTTSQAAQMVGISRSAFYKYKDRVFAQGTLAADSMLTLTATLSDEPGVLSRFTSELYAAGANILTVNQNIPVDGVALVSVSARSDNLRMDTGELLEQLKAMEGIVDVRMISGR